MELKSAYLSFIKQLTALSVLVALFGWLIFRFLLHFTTFYSLFALILLYYCVSATVHFALLKAGQKKFQRFVPYFMFATTVKLLIYITAFLIYMFAYHYNPVVFVLSFLIMYMIYTIFEISLLLKYFRRSRISAGGEDNPSVGE